MSDIGGHRNIGDCTASKSKRTVPILSVIIVHSGTFGYLCIGNGSNKNILPLFQAPSIMHVCGYIVLCNELTMYQLVQGKARCVTITVQTLIVLILIMALS